MDEKKKPGPGMIICSVCGQEKPKRGSLRRRSIPGIVVCSDCRGKCVRCGVDTGSRNRLFCKKCWSEAKKNGWAFPDPKISVASQELEAMAHERNLLISPITGRAYPNDIHLRLNDDFEGNID